MNRKFLVFCLLIAAAAGLEWYRRSLRPAEPNPVTLAFGDVELAAVVTADEVKRLGWDLQGDFQVSPEGFILLQSGGTIINVAGAEPILTQPRADLKSFCAVGEGVVAVCGSWLCGYNPENGTLEPAVQLPSDRMLLASAGRADSFYLHENTATGGDIYLFTAGGSCTKLVHTEKPILAVAGQDERLFFSVWSKIFTWKQGEAAVLILDLGQGLGTAATAPITSLAVDPKTGLLFFSSGEGIYALFEGNPVLLLAGCSGDLQFSRGRLFVKDRRQAAILEVRGAAEAIFRTRVQSP
jgi:hypothetical protein